MPTFVLDNFVEGWVLGLTGNKFGSLQALALVDNGELTVSPDNKVRVKGRRGFTVLNASAIDSATADVVSLHHFALGTFSHYLAHVIGSTNKYYVSSNGGSTWAAATGTPTFGSGGIYTQFVSWPTRTLAIACQGTVDEDSGSAGSLYTYNGTTFAALTQSGVQMNDLPIAIYRERLIGCRSDTRGKEFYMTKADQETVTDTDRTVAVNDGSGSRIMGFTTESDRLGILKERSLWYILGDPLSDGQKVQYAPSGPGPTSRRSIAQTPWGTVYVSRRGVFITDLLNPVPEDITGPLRILFRDRVNDSFYGEAVGVYVPESKQYWLKLTPGDGLVYVLTRLELPGNKVTLAWSRFSSQLVGGYPLVCGTLKQRPDADAGKLMVGGTDGKVYGTDTGTTDAGASDYQVAWRTPTVPMDATPMERPGRVHYVDVEWLGDDAASLLFINDAGTTYKTATIGSAGAVRWQRARVYNDDFNSSDTRWTIQFQQTGGGENLELRRFEVKTKLMSHKRVL